MAIGRPTKCTPEVTARVCKAIKLGMTYRLAAQYGGIDYATMRRWMIQGEQRRKIFCEFHDAVKAAEAEGIAANLANIHRAAKDGSWQASAWLLERRYRQDYGRHTVVQVEERKVTDLTDAELEAQILEIADAIRRETKAKRKAKAKA